jgi:plastocyanin
MLRTSLVIAALVVCAAPALADTDWTQAKRVEIDMSNYAYAPQPLRLTHGVPYVLHFVNSAQKSHDFSAPQFFAASTVAADDQAKLVKGAVDLEEGQTADVKLIVNAAGTYDVRCTHFMHAMLGMTGKVIVD